MTGAEALGGPQPSSAAVLDPHKSRDAFLVELTPSYG